MLGARGEFLAGDADLPVPDDDAPRPRRRCAFATTTVHGVPVRVAYLWLRRPRRDRAPYAALVQVAETLDKRSRLATEIIKGVILPQFVILPVAVVLVWFALARGIQPLADLQQRIRRRESTDLSPIAERDVPDEVAPLVRAINDLLERLDQSMRHAEAVPGRRRAPAEDAAGRPAHAGRTGRARDRQRRRATRRR